jgi:putative toxin-antitoxin system antitoxin component (TIGR02293 family)
VNPRSTVASILGQPDTEARFNDSQRLSAELSKGLPFGALKGISATYGLSLEQLSPVVGISARTLGRRRREGTFRAHESDRIGRLARILAHADDTFGDHAKVGRWLVTEIRALGYVAPLSLMVNDAGVLAVDQILGRIDHGVFS